MASRRKRSWLLLYVLLPLVTILLFLADISLGSVRIPINQILGILAGNEPANPAWTLIVNDFRIPRAITALLVGAGLAISGLQMQTMFRNPLAGPFVLGISSGSSLGVALTVLLGVQWMGSLFATNLGSWITVISATLGAALVFAFILAISFRVRDNLTLLIVGLMFGSATSAIVGILQFFSPGEEIKIYLLWTFGSLGGVDWEKIGIFIPVILAGITVSFLLFKPMNALLLGEDYAGSMGVNVKRTRIWIIISTALLAGTITAFCGPIAFIGIAVPHLTRILFNTADHRTLIPAVAFTGMIVLLVCDIISQMPGSQQVLPINAVTSLVGAPVIIWIVVRKRNVKTSLS